MWWTLLVLDEGHGSQSIFKKGFLSAWKANEVLITNFEIILMRRFLLEVKDQEHHSPNGDRKFNFWLIREAWNISGLFCIIIGELILLIQCMKIRFIETFIKAFRVGLMSGERTWGEKEIWSDSHGLSLSPHWLSSALPFSSVKWRGLLLSLAVEAKWFPEEILYLKKD